jgi:adenine-specific DNA-methyltransferase
MRRPYSQLSEWRGTITEPMTASPSEETQPLPVTDLSRGWSHRGQLTLLGEVSEEPEFLTRQLVTYIGNKRALLGPIRDATETISERLGTRKLRILDAFSGSGVVSRMFKKYARELVVNDIEDYARSISECYLTNRSNVNLNALSMRVAELNRLVDTGSIELGFIRALYAPENAAAIKESDRVFYTPENANRLDAYRQLLEHEGLEMRTLLMGPLLAAASVHANTAGVFKGFYKDRHTGIGKYGGSGADALSRITASIRLEAPILSAFECDYEIHQKDANKLAREVRGFDVVYLDPPYNQHPYGSNYFMLHLLVNYEKPTDVSRVSGIPSQWRRSDYNVRSRALPRFKELAESLDTKFLIVSFSDEGFIAPSVMRELLMSLGEVTEYRQQYATFRGSRNLRNRNLSVTEHVYVVEKR